MSSLGSHRLRSGTIKPLLPRPSVANPLRRRAGAPEPCRRAKLRLVDRTLEGLISVVETGDDTPGLTQAERTLAAELIALEREEREVSALRRKLHERLASFPNPVTEERERHVSRHRGELHQRVDLLRDELAMLGGERSSGAGPG